MLIVTVSVMLNLPPLTECRPEPPVIATQHWFQATQTAIEPWLGRHHVYGVFTIPEQYRFDHLYTAKLFIEGFPEAFEAGSPEDAEVSQASWEQGHYRKRVYLSTRTALRFLWQGRFGDLRTTCHWWLVISER